MKDDFVAAQKLATLQAQKDELEFLAILATRDKLRIFNINTTLNEVTSQSVSDNDSSDRALFVFKINSKNSNTHFKGNSRININKNSPFAIRAAYKLTVKYTLTVPTEQTTTVNFIISNSSTRKEVITKTETKTVIVSAKRPTANIKLDFGNITIARSSKALGGIGKIKLELAGDPTISTEIIKVEKVHG